MRILADENFPGDAVTALRARGHDVLWVRTEAPGMSDREVLARAQAEDRIVITFDKDFGELAFRFGLPATSGIILFRLAARTARRARQWQVRRGRYWKLDSERGCRRSCR